MDGDGADHFEAFVDALAEVVGHADRVRPLRDYCMGLLTPAERKSVEPLAAVTAPSRVSAQHQSLLHFVAQSPWSDARVLAKVLELTLPSITAREPIEAWIIDDTSFPKKGKHSVGVTRQYSGQLGKQDNCQVAVSLSLANAGASFPIAYRLYLPKDWAADPARRKKAGVPEEVTFRTKPEIALDQIRAALEAGAPPGVVLMDAGYGADTSLRSALAGLGLAYVAGVQPHTSVWTHANPSPAVRPWSGRGRPTSRMVRDPDHQPQSVEGLALSLPAEAWEMISWREGSADVLISRFARVRVRAAHRDFDRSVPRDEEWLLVEWPTEEEKPTKFWLATVLKTSPSTASSRSRSCAGASSGTTRNSNRSSGSGTSRDEVGEASITMPPYASPPTPFWSPNGRRFPPQNLPVSSRRLQFPPVRPAGRPPIRPERHVANSISTMRRTLIVELVRKLERCPCCMTVTRMSLTL